MSDSIPWDAIGAIGELLGAVLLVGSLIYVGVQIRDAKKQIKAATSQARTDAFVQLWQIRFKPEFVEAELRARQNPESISASDRHYLLAFLTTFLNHQQNSYYQREMGLLEHAQSGGLDTMPVLRAVPYYRELWKSDVLRETYNKGFAAHVDSIIDGMGT